MKKFLSIALSIVMLASMLLLSGCGSQAIVGKWEGEMDMTDALTEEILASDEGMAEYFEFKDFKVDVIYEINSDGTYSYEMTEESLKEAMNAVVDAMKEGMPAYLEAMASEMGMTFDDLLPLMEVSSVDEMIDTMFTDEMMEEMLSDMDDLSGEGKYKAEDGKFYTSDDLDSDVSEDEYMSYELDGKTLTFTEYVGDEEETAELGTLILPLVLHRK